MTKWYTKDSNIVDTVELFITNNGSNYIFGMKETIVNLAIRNP